jgi:hypothetical protein
MTTTQPTKTIRIACKAADLLDTKEIQGLQGELKDLSKENYEKLKASMVRHGFTSPVHVWRGKKAYYNLDGHQRMRVLERLTNEGWKIPKIPVVFIEAKTLKDAKEILLTHASTYGEMNEQGLLQFVIENELSPEWMAEHLHFADLDLGKFFDSNFNDPAGDPNNLSNAGEDGVTPGPGIPSSSAQVRMVQLFFSGDNHPEFMKKAAELSAKYGTDNVTDTIMEAVREAHRSHFPNRN